MGGFGRGRGIGECTVECGVVLRLTPTERAIEASIQPRELMCSCCPIDTYRLPVRVWEESALLVYDCLSQHKSVSYTGEITVLLNGILSGFCWCLID